MASGIKYSNANYEITEWLGEIRLKKKRESDFKNKK